MYRLKGFMQINSSAARQPSGISIWGELSPQSLTYSKNRKLYIDNTTDIELFVFSSKDSNGNIDPPTLIRGKVFDITNWLINIQSNPTTRLLNKADLLVAITNQFDTIVSGVNIGEIVVDNNEVPFPEWIGFSVINTGTIKIENEVKVWYSDQAFLNQYDETEIVVVPPLDHIDHMFSPSAALPALLDAYCANNLVDKIQEVKGVLPESAIVTNDFLWYDPNSAVQINTKWVVLLYGRIGNNIDAIKHAIREYILANSTKSEDDWKIIFPDIFRNTLFYIFPRWKKYAIQERKLETGQYLSVSDPNKEIEYTKKVLPNLSSVFISTNLRIIPSNYKSLMVNIIGGIDNKNNIFSIEGMYSDLLNVPTTDPLFDLMSTNTKNWIIKLMNATKVAEEIGSYDSIPAGMSKVVINNILFVSFESNNVTYLVSTKQSTPGY